VPVVQKNFSYFLYIDDNAVNWDVFGEDGGPGSAVDGHTTDFTHPAWGRNTRRRHVRYAVYQDPSSFRTVKCVIYTPTAFAAIVAGDTVSVPIPGSDTNTTYTLSAKIAERQPIPKASRHLAET
jgi:hypothetical protein